MPTRKQIDKARAMGALVTELLTEHADIIDDITVSLKAWPSFAMGDPERAQAYFQAFVERYELDVKGEGATGIYATMKNETFGRDARISMSMYAPSPSSVKGD